MEKGVVKWFNGAKGFGFIKRETGEDYVFVRFTRPSSVKGTRPSTRAIGLSLTSRKGLKGLQALRVTKI